MNTQATNQTSQQAQRYEARETRLKGETYYYIFDRERPTSRITAYFSRYDEARAYADQKNRPQSQTSEKPASVKLTDLPAENFLQVVFTSEKLTRELDEHFNESANYDFEELICTYLDGCRYSLGTYNQNYITVESSTDFLDGIERKAKEIATSQQVLSLVKQCKALQDKGSNLFEYMVCNELKDAVLNEAEGIADYWEGISYAIYNKDASDKELKEQTQSNVLDTESYPFESMILDLTSGKVFDTIPETTITPDQLKAVAAALNRL